MTATTTTTLAGFLLARIAEDEEAARVAIARRPTVTRVDVTGAWLNSRFHMTVDPARVLAECEAKRRIVEKVTEAIAWDDGVSEPVTTSALAARDALKFLALPYADHPDYREEWRA